MSLNVASGVDFLVGMIAAVDAGLVGAGELALVGDEAFGGAAGEAAFVAAGELLFSGAIGADFSVVTDTLGAVAGDSDVSGAAVSGAGAGVSPSSWAQARGAVATTNAVRAMMAIFICIFLLFWS